MLMSVNMSASTASRALDSAPPGFAETVQDSLPVDPSQAFGDSTPMSVAPDWALPVDTEQTIDHVGRYALKRLIGAGGLGNVYAGWDPLLSRAVAVKTLNLEHAGQDSLHQLFLHEARAVAALSHPHIVTVFDAGLDPQHGVYLAMEHLQGRDLRHMLAEGWQPSPAQAARLVLRVAEALNYAHDMGVIHCDIKPANIFMLGERRPKVLDFGIARVARQGGSLQAGSGPSAGSPQYAAPEQLRGGSADARTDVHALGVLLYELLCGRRAFEGQSLAQVEAAVAGTRPAAAHVLRPDLPKALSRIAERAMALDPEARYDSAGDMALALRRWSQHNARMRARSATTGPAAMEQPAPAATVALARPAAQRKLTRRLGIACICVLAVALTCAYVAWHSPPGSAGPGVQAAQPLATALAGTPPVPAPAPPAAPGPALQATQGESPASSGPSETAAGPGAAPSPASARLTSATPTPAIARKAAQTLAPAAVQTAPEASPATGASTQAAPLVAPVATGQLQLAISPWGQVEVDGRAMGTTPPLSRLDLPAGQHVVVIRNEDFAPFSITVHIRADQAAVVRHRFGS